MLPALKLVHEEVVPLGDLGKFAVHSALEIDEVLPCLHSISRVLIPFTNNLVEMTHRNLGHERLLLSAAEDCFDAGIAAELFADVVHDAHDRVLIPPRWALNALDLTTHDNDLSSRYELASTVC